MRRFTVRIAALLAALCYVLVLAPTAHADDPYRPAGAVEARFLAPGPWAVSAEQNFGCCDSTGAAYDLWYPTDLGAHGIRHPIVTWGDGTAAVPHRYDYLLRHLASWGFVVIATENRNTGSGVDIAGAARYLIEQAARPDSIFHGRLDIEKVGAIGHSQGATGALNAMITSGGLITTAVALELPAQSFCSASSCTDTRRLNSGSVLFVNGGDDALISPAQQPPWQPAGLQSNQAYYDATPAAVTRAWGTLIHANHNDVQGQPGCADASLPCTTGVYGYLGYPTAWLMAQLGSCDYARRAFIPGTGEFYEPNPNWVNQIGTAAR
jgi:hypothetical protein